MKYCIFDPSQHFIGLQLLFPEADYYSLPENQFTRNNKIYEWSPQDVFYKKYNFAYKNNIESINSENYDILITGMPFYDGVRKGSVDCQKLIYDFIFNVIINKNKFKKIIFIDNYDYDYDPNDYIEPIPNLIFLKRNYNKNIKYKNNVYSFPFVIFGYPTCILWSILNNHDKYKDHITKVEKCFWAGTLFHHKDELGYPVDRNRNAYYNMIKGHINTYHGLPSEIFLKTMQNHKYSVDLYGVGDPNRRTIEILWTRTLIIQQKTNLLYPFEDGNLVPNELQFDTEEEFVSIRSMLEDENTYSKYLKIQNDRFDKYYTVDWLRSYIEDIIKSGV
jgi:hypothetical protein